MDGIRRFGRSVLALAGMVFVLAGAGLFFSACGLAVVTAVLAAPSPDGITAKTGKELREAAQLMVEPTNPDWYTAYYLKVGVPMIGREGFSEQYRLLSELQCRQRIFKHGRVWGGLISYINVNDRQAKFVPVCYTTQPPTDKEAVFVCKFLGRSLLKNMPTRKEPKVLCGQQFDKEKPL